MSPNIQAAPTPTMDIESVRLPLPLVVDLDGTFVRTDTLVELAVSSLARRPVSVLLAFGALIHGRAALKAALASQGDLDVGSLPLRLDLFQYLTDQRHAGRAIHLVSAADQSIVDRIAAAYPLFDSAQGSAGGVNLKGRRKLAALQSRFSEGFIYAGDSAADLHVWRQADGIVLAGAGRLVSRRAHALRKPIEAEFHGEPRSVGAWLATWVSALRLHQWSKNALVAVPLLLSGSITLSKVWAVVAGFVLIGMAASATYLINDLADLHADRLHRSKHSRPFASGDLPLFWGVVAAGLLLLAAALGALALSSAFAWALAIYVGLTLSYSAGLKRTPLLDVFVLAALYVLRLLMGTVLGASSFSPWLLTFSAFFFFSLSLAKRHAELMAAKGPADELIPGRGYRPADAPLTLALGLASAVAAILVIIQYMMAEAFPSNVYSFPAALWATPVIVALWTSRIWLLAQRDQLDDDPVAFAVSDKISLALGGTIGLVFLLAHFL